MFDIWVFSKAFLKFQRIFSWCREKQDLKALETSLQTGRGSERELFSLEQFNNRKSPGSEPTRTVLLTQPGYVLQLQHTLEVIFRCWSPEVKEWHLFHTTGLKCLGNPFRLTSLYTRLTGGKKDRWKEILIGTIPHQLRWLHVFRVQEGKSCFLHKTTLFRKIIKWCLNYNTICFLCTAAV